MTDIHLITGDHFVTGDPYEMKAWGPEDDCLIIKSVRPGSATPKTILIPKTAIAYILDP